MTRPWTWHLVRATAVVLAVGMPILFVRSVLTPDIARTTVAAVHARWANPMWRAAEWIVCALALLHASLAIGRRAASRGAATRVLIDVGVGVVGASMMVTVTSAMLATS